jgi:hypothetical protein
MPNRYGKEKPKLRFTVLVAGFNSWRRRKDFCRLYFWFEFEFSASISPVLGSTPSAFHLLEKSFFWFGCEVPALISLVFDSTPSDSKFYFADHFPSNSKFEKVDRGFDSHTNLFCRSSSRPPTLKSSSKFQNIFLFSNIQSGSLNCVIPGAVWIS